MSQFDKSAAIDLLIGLLQSNGAVSNVLRSAHQEGRTINKQELEQAFDRDNEARSQLEQAISKAS